MFFFKTQALNRDIKKNIEFARQDNSRSCQGRAESHLRAVMTDIGGKDIVWHQSLVEEVGYLKRNLRCAMH